MSPRPASKRASATALPDDPAIDALAATTRGHIADRWANRAAAELAVGSIFTVVARGLFERGADPKVLAIVARAVSDEVRHAEICVEVARRYRGGPVAWPSPAPVPMPRLASAPAALRPTLHVVAMGCVNETIACAWLERSLKETKSALPRAATRAFIADDIHHARVGWAHLASPFVSATTRRQLGEWLPQLLEAASWKMSRESAYPHPEGFPTHGFPAASTTREVIRDTLSSVVLPGFEEMGVPVARARQWWARTFEA